ncbi:MAG: TadE family protein, partial [Acidimicrobiales bacterium]
MSARREFTAGSPVGGPRSGHSLAAAGRRIQTLKPRSAARRPFRRRRRPEHGAALVEFALVFPLFFMLVLAMFTGGVAYNAKLS